MADVELIIKVPEELLNKIDDENYQKVIEWYNTTLYCALKDGIKLPKEHERLLILSKDKLKENLFDLSFSCQKWISEVGLSNATVTIIEANKETDDYYRGAQEEY